MIKITLIYAAILSLIFIVLSLRVIKGRFKTKTSLGDGGNADLTAKIRTHGNFAEYIPLALILLMGVEYLEYPSVVVHSFGILLIFGRLIHAYGLSKVNVPSAGRPAGMITTFSIIFISAILILTRTVL